MTMTQKGQVDYWLKLSNNSLLDMRAALRSGRRVNALFCGHLALSQAQQIELTTITTFNIEARYENHKMSPSKNPRVFGGIYDARFGRSCPIGIQFLASSNKKLDNSQYM